MLTCAVVQCSSSLISPLVAFSNIRSPDLFLTSYSFFDHFVLLNVRQGTFASFWFSSLSGYSPIFRTDRRPLPDGRCDRKDHNHFLYRFYMSSPFSSSTSLFFQHYLNLFQFFQGCSRNVHMLVGYFLVNVFPDQFFQHLRIHYNFQMFHHRFSNQF